MYKIVVQHFVCFVVGGRNFSEPCNTDYSRVTLGMFLLRRRKNVNYILCVFEMVVL